MSTEIDTPSYSLFMAQPDYGREAYRHSYPEIDGAFFLYFDRVGTMKSEINLFFLFAFINFAQIAEMPVILKQL